jgi:hypothetical protein
MNSSPLIENLPEFPEKVTEEVFMYPAAATEGKDHSQQVDILRAARLSRALARWEGALSETPHRVTGSA